METFPELVRDLVMKLEGKRRVSVVLAGGQEYLAFARAKPAWLELYELPPIGNEVPPDTYVGLESIVAIAPEPYAEDE